ncbi:MAG: protein-export chaperone SecB [Holosporales bacterium]|jgi:preprotein translocase subunit SecB|nr:protein-export chaperone SecB [Holosporales bacterium]
MADNTNPVENNSLFTIPVQYLVDLSLENPKPLVHLTSTSEDKPEISINVQVNARHLTERMFEVILDINSKATRGADTMFICQVKYGGLIAIGEQVEESQIKNILLESCPEFLFPFVRNIIADATRETGFPALMLQPVDFKAMNKSDSANADGTNQIH